MVWRLNAADLLQLKGGGGVPFAHFMDRLIRAEAASRGLPQAEIAAQLRVNIRDGGVDTEVKQPIPGDQTGWFGVPTCWQFKSVDAKDLDTEEKKGRKNELQNEICKPYVTELIRKGYGYRLCLLGDLTPVNVRNWEAQLKAEATTIFAGAADPRVIHGGDLLAWAERFFGMVAGIRNLPQGILHWDAWAANRRAVTPNYVRNTDWEGVRRQVLEHVQFDRPCVAGEPCLFIGGAAGVGKTRLVFETLAELPEPMALVAVVEDEQEAKRTATWLANIRGQFAILVADECSQQARYALNEILRGHVDRVRVITIDNASEPQASAASRIVLTAGDALKNAESILEANFSYVPQDRRRQYADLSRGFVRLAADMCRHDAQIAAGDLTQIQGSVEGYARERLGERLKIVSAIALFHKLGFRDDVAGELDVVARFTGFSRQAFHDAVRAVRESPGFVVQAGRYWYVTPEIVAQVLFNEAWERWASADLKQFLEQLPDDLRQQVLDRVKTHARKEVRDQVGTFFRDWFSNLTAVELAAPELASLAAAIVETSPDQFLPQLRAALEAAQPGELQRIKGHAAGARWGPRRTLVWLFERLVSFPEFFADCEASLFRLAVEESELEIGNNSTATWANLHSVYLSGTAMPFLSRLPILEKRLATPTIAEARLAFGALTHALLELPGHILGAPVVAGRLRPTDWAPQSPHERRACLSAALEACAAKIRAGFDEHHRLAFEVIARCLNHLIRVGLFEEVRQAVTPEYLTEDEGRKLLRVVEELLAHEDEIFGLERVGAASPVRAPNNEYLEKVRQWVDQWRPTGFTGRLREVCARSPWDRRFDQDMAKQMDETANLAASILQEPMLLVAELTWLASPEALSAERLGFAIGRIDVMGECGRLIFKHAIAHKTAPVLRGYIRGMVHEGRPPGSDLLALMTRLESSHPELAVDILSNAGDAFDALQRILRLVDTHSVSAKCLATLARGLGRRELSAEEVNHLIPYFTGAAERGDAETAVAGVRFLNTYLLFEHRHSQKPCLTAESTRSLVWQFTESVVPYLTGNIGADWAKVVNKLASFDSDRAARVLGQGLLSENITLREESKDELRQLAKAYPESVMKGFGSALLTRDRGWLLQVTVCRDLVGLLPPKVVIEWVRQNGIEAARAIARHLPMPYVDEAGVPTVPEVLDTILREYDDDDVQSSFWAGSHSAEAWWGNGADRFKQAAESAKGFLNHPNVRIGRWAKEEIHYRLRLAEREDRKQEERLLPF